MQLKYLSLLQLNCKIYKLPILVSHTNVDSLTIQKSQINFQLTRVNKENSKKLGKTFLYILSSLSDIRSFLFINFSERVQLIIIQRNLLIKMFSTHLDKRVLPTVAIQLVTTPTLAEILQKNGLVSKILLNFVLCFFLFGLHTGKNIAVLSQLFFDLILTSFDQVYF